MMLRPSAVVELDVERQLLGVRLVAERPRHRLEQIGEEDFLRLRP